MSSEKKPTNYALLALSGVIAGCLTAWQAAYAFFWTFGTWLPMWPAIIVIIVWAGVLSFVTAWYRELSKPVPWTLYVFSQTIGLIWFMCWMATFSPLRFPLVK